MQFPASVFDVEVYSGFAMCGFLDMDTGEIRQFTTEPDIGETLEALRAYWAHERQERLFIGFNNLSYDNHILRMLLSDAPDTAAIYKLSLARIADQEDWANRVESVAGEPNVDLYALNGGKHARIGSLKEIGVKLNYHTLQELPYPFDALLTHEQMVEVCAYNQHDLRITRLAAECCAEQIEQRIELSIECKVRVLNKHDAAVAEAVMAQALFGVGKRDYPTETAWHLSGKELVKGFRFEHPALQALLDRIAVWELDMRIVETPDE